VKMLNLRDMPQQSENHHYSPAEYQPNVSIAPHIGNMLWIGPLAGG
jgi:hypothetical protein